MSRRRSSAQSSRREEQAQADEEASASLLDACADQLYRFSLIKPVASDRSVRRRLEAVLCSPCGGKHPMLPATANVLKASLSMADINELVFSGQRDGRDYRAYRTVVMRRQRHDACPAVPAAPGKQGDQASEREENLLALCCICVHEPVGRPGLKRTAELIAFATRPTQRKEGNGRLLVAIVKGICASVGCAYVVVSAANNVQSFWAAVGFEPNLSPEEKLWVDTDCIQFPGTRMMKFELGHENDDLEHEQDDGSSGDEGASQDSTGGSGVAVVVREEASPRRSNRQKVRLSAAADDTVAIDDEDEGSRRAREYTESSPSLSGWHGVADGYVRQVERHWRRQQLELLASERRKAREREEARQQKVRERLARERAKELARELRLRERALRHWRSQKVGEGEWRIGRRAALRRVVLLQLLLQDVVVSANGRPEASATQQGSVTPPTDAAATNDVSAVGNADDARTSDTARQLLCRASELSTEDGQRALVTRLEASFGPQLYDRRSRRAARAAEKARAQARREAEAKAMAEAMLKAQAAAAVAAASTQGAAPQNGGADASGVGLGADERADVCEAENPGMVVVKDEIVGHNAAESTPSIATVQQMIPNTTPESIAVTDSAPASSVAVKNEECEPPPWEPLGQNQQSQLQQGKAETLKTSDVTPEKDEPVLRELDAKLDLGFRAEFLGSLLAPLKCEISSAAASANAVTTAAMHAAAKAAELAESALGPLKLEATDDNVAEVLSASSSTGPKPRATRQTTLAAEQEGSGHAAPLSIAALERHDIAALLLARALKVVRDRARRAVSEVAVVATTQSPLPMPLPHMQNAQTEGISNPEGKPVSAPPAVTCGTAAVESLVVVDHASAHSTQDNRRTEDDCALSVCPIIELLPQDLAQNTGTSAQDGKTLFSADVVTAELGTGDIPADRWYMSLLLVAQCMQQLDFDFDGPDGTQGAASDAELDVEDSTQAPIAAAADGPKAGSAKVPLIPALQELLEQLMSAVMPTRRRKRRNVSDTVGGAKRQASGEVDAMHEEALPLMLRCGAKPRFPFACTPLLCPTTPIEVYWRLDQCWYRGVVLEISFEKDNGTWVAPWFAAWARGCPRWVKRARRAENEDYDSDDDTPWQLQLQQQTQDEMQREAHELMRALALANMLKKKPALPSSRAPKTKMLMLLADGITQVKRPLTAYNYFCRRHAAAEAATSAEESAPVVKEAATAPAVPVPLASSDAAPAVNDNVTESVTAPAAEAAVAELASLAEVSTNGAEASPSSAANDASSAPSSSAPSSSAPSRPSDRIREVGNMWSALSEEGKGPFRELAARDKLRYDREIALAEKVVVPAKWKWRAGGVTAREAAVQLQTELASLEPLAPPSAGTAGAADADAHVIVKHHIRYDDGEQEWLRLDLERFRISGVEWSKDGVVHAPQKRKSRESSTPTTVSPPLSDVKAMPQRMHQNKVLCATSATEHPAEHPMREYMRAFRLARIVGGATFPPLSLLSLVGHKNSLGNSVGAGSNLRSVKRSAFACAANLDASNGSTALGPKQSAASVSGRAKRSSKWSNQNGPGSPASGASSKIELKSPRSKACKPPTKAALRAFAAAAAAESGGVQWRSSGHTCIGRRVRRIFRHAIIADGTIACWAPAGPGGDDPPLWRVLHDDGDTEDLEEHEMKEARRMHDKQATPASMPAPSQEGMVGASDLDIVLRSLAPLRLCASKKVDVVDGSNRGRLVSIYCRQDGSRYQGRIIQSPADSSCSGGGEKMTRSAQTRRHRSTPSKTAVEVSEAALLLNETKTARVRFAPCKKTPDQVAVEDVVLFEHAVVIAGDVVWAKVEGQPWWPAMTHVVSPLQKQMTSLPCAVDEANASTRSPKRARVTRAQHALVFFFGAPCTAHWLRVDDGAQVLPYAVHRNELAGRLKGNAAGVNAVKLADDEVAQVGN